MKEKESIKEVFGNLTTALYRIKEHRNSSFNQQNYLRRIKLDIITDKIFDFPLKKALHNLNLVLSDLAEIKVINSKVVFIEPTGDKADVREEAFDEEEGHFIPDEDGNPRLMPSPRDWYKREVKAKESNERELNKIEAELIALKDEILKKIAVHDTSTPHIKAGKGEVEKTTTSNEILSFNYEQTTQSQDNITQLKGALITHSLIDPETSIGDFRKVFANVKIDTRIKWTGSPSEFAYFIKLLCHTYKKVEVKFQMRFKVAAYCFFVPSNKGTEFEWRKLKGLQPPANASYLEKLAKLL